MLINFWTFFQGPRPYSRRAMFINFWICITYLFMTLLLFILWLSIKNSNYLLFERGLRLSFRQNYQGAMFVHGAIPDSRVHTRSLLFANVVF